MTDGPPRFDHLRSTWPRRERLRGIVLHWTGGSGNAAQVYRSMRAAVGPRTPDGTSCHFIIDSDGTVHRTASTSLVCVHGNAANPWSIGIEVACPGYPGKVADAEARRGIHRDAYTDNVRTRQITMMDYTTAQTDAVTLLCERLCDEHKIARAVPLAPDGSLLRRQMTDVELATFSGVLGHFHVHGTKNDPGTRPLERLRLRWGGKARH